MKAPIRQVPRMMELQNVNGSATAPTVPSHGSSANPQKDKDMNKPEDSTAVPATASRLGHLEAERKLEALS